MRLYVSVFGFEQLLGALTCQVLDYVHMLAGIQVPTLVVVGRDDEFTPIADAELMRGRIPNAALVIVEGAAHMPNLEREAEFNRAPQDFLDSLPPAAERER